MAQIQFELQELYRRQFGTKPKLGKELAPALTEGYKIQGDNSNYLFTTQGSNLKADFLGQEIWLPVRFIGLDFAKFNTSELLLPYAVVKISGKKKVIKTPLPERGGNVIEEYSIDSYDIQITGFLIDKNRIFPDAELDILHKLYLSSDAIRLDNALTNIFLQEGGYGVFIEAFELPEVEGGRKHVRPFALRLTSDSLFTLELE